MAHSINKVSATKISKLVKAGFHSDGGGLDWKITKGGAGVKSRLFWYMLAGHARVWGLALCILLAWPRPDQRL
jgi:hypothetical protein